MSLIVKESDFWKWVKDEPKLTGFRRRYETAMSQTLRNYNWQVKKVDKLLEGAGTPEEDHKVIHAPENRKHFQKMTNIINTPHGRVLGAYLKAEHEIVKIYMDEIKGEL